MSNGSSGKTEEATSYNDGLQEGLVEASTEEREHLRRELLYVFRNRVLVVENTIGEDDLVGFLRKTNHGGLVGNRRLLDYEERYAYTVAPTLFVRADRPNTFRWLLRQACIYAYGDKYPLEPGMDRQARQLFLYDLVTDRAEYIYKHELAHRRALPRNYLDADVHFGISFYTSVYWCNSGEPDYIRYIGLNTDLTATTKFDTVLRGVAISNEDHIRVLEAPTSMSSVDRDIRSGLLAQGNKG